MREQLVQHTTFQVSIFDKKGELLEEQVIGTIPILSKKHFNKFTSDGKKVLGILGNYILNYSTHKGDLRCYQAILESQEEKLIKIEILRL